MSKVGSENTFLLLPPWASCYPRINPSASENPFPLEPGNQLLPLFRDGVGRTSTVMRQIGVQENAASGKSTLARALARELG
jgi:hypothetical protein